MLYPFQPFLLCYLGVFLYHFLLPGLLLCYLLNIRRLATLQAVALSYATLILTLLPLEHLGASAASFTRLINTEIFILLALASLKAIWVRWSQGCVILTRGRRVRARGLQKWPTCRPGAPTGRVFQQNLFSVFRRPSSVFAALVFFCLLAGYLIYARPYLEIPADAWDHLQRFQAQAALLATDRVPAFSLGHDTLFASGPHWYWLHAYLCQRAGISVRESLPPLALATGLTFCAALFALSWWLTARLRITRGLKIMAAILAALFGLLHQGINVFSFVRYYAFAPAILNYTVIFAALTILADFLQRRSGYGRTLWLLPILLFTSAIVHVQETVWAFFFIGSMVIYSSLIGKARKTRLLLALIIIAFGAGYILIRIHYPFVYSSPLVTTLPITVPLFGPLRILAPSGQFYQVVTAWGLWVYFLALLYRKQLRGQTYLVGGLLLPLWTVFNPLTVDMFLRFSPSAISVLYRNCYAIPLALSGALLATLALKSVVVRRPCFAKASQSKPLSVSGPLLVLSGLIVFLFPVRTQRIELPYSRSLTLRPVAAANDDRWWSDLADFMAVQKDAILFSDLATTYVLSRLTGLAAVDAGKWLSSRETDPNLLPWDALSDSTAPWRLIINRRDGAPSVVGRVSGHWPEDVMNVSRYYSPECLAWIKSHPQVFRKIWQRDRIEVYAVDRNALLLTLPKTPFLVSAVPACWEGPGIRLDWADVCPTAFIGYNIQCSTDGQVWQDIGAQREYCWSWFNHQGAKTDTYGTWSYCLPSGQTYFYRVRAIYATETGAWSNVKSGAVANYR